MTKTFYLFDVYLLFRDLSNNKIDIIADDAFEGLENLEDV